MPNPTDLFKAALSGTPIVTSTNTPIDPTSEFIKQLPQSQPVNVGPQTAVEGFAPNPDYDFSKENSENPLDTNNDWINTMKLAYDNVQKSGYQAKKYNLENELNTNADRKDVLEELLIKDPANKDKYIERLKEINDLDNNLKESLQSAEEGIKTNEDEIANEPVSKLYKMKEALANSKGSDQNISDIIDFALPSGLGSMAGLGGQMLVATFGREAIKRIVGAAVTGLAEGAAAGAIAAAPTGELAAPATVPLGAGIVAATATITQIGLGLSSAYNEAKSEIGESETIAREALMKQWIKDNPDREPTEKEIRKIQQQAHKGIDEQFWTNMIGLSVDNAAEILLGSSLFKGSSILKGAEKFGGYNKYTRFAKASALTYGNILKEKAEEGGQFVAQKRQYDTALNLGQYENKGFLKNILSDGADVLKSINLGLPYQSDTNLDGKYASNKEFQASSEAGGLLGLIGGAVGTSVRTYKDVSNYLETSKELKATGIANPNDKVFKLKDDIYQKHFKNDTVEFLLEGIRNLSDQKDDKGVPLMTHQQAIKEVTNVVDAFNKYKEVSEHIDNIENKGFLSIKKSPEQKVMLNALKSDLFHTSMQLTREKENINHIETYENINNLIEHQETLIDQIKATKDNQPLAKTYNLKERLSIAENKLNKLKETKKLFIESLPIESKNLADAFISIEDSNKNKESLIAELNANEQKSKYTELLKVKDNKTLKEWYDKKTKTQKDIVKTIEKIPGNETLTPQEQSVKDFAIKLATKPEGEQLTPEELDFYEKNKNEVEKELINNENVNDDPLEINKTSTTDVKDVPGDNASDGSPKKTNIHTTESGIDDNNKSFYKFTSTHTTEQLVQHKLQVVTKNNSPKLYQEILDQNPDSKVLDKADSIWTIVVDKNNKPVLQDNKYVVSTLSTPERVTKKDIITKDNKKAAQDLATFRTKLLEQKTPVYLPITSKSKGIAVHEPTIEGRRQSNSLVGRFVDNLKNLTLELPTKSVVGEDNRVELSNGQIGYTGKLYAKNKATDQIIDLVPRTVNPSEIVVLIDLIKQRLGINKRVTSPSKEIGKLIYFINDISKAKKIHDSTIGLNKDTNVLTIGLEQLTAEQLQTLDGEQKLHNFLLTKYVNVSNDYNENDKFNGPIVDDKETPKEYSSYKEYLLSGEKPMFGTDLKPKSEIQFKQQYLNYDPNFKTDDLPKSRTPIDDILDLPFDIRDLDKTSEERVNIDDIFKLDTTPTIVPETKPTSKRTPKPTKGKLGDQTLDRLITVTTETKPLEQSEVDWFTKSFPKIW